MGEAKDQGKPDGSSVPDPGGQGPREPIPDGGTFDKPLEEGEVTEADALDDREPGNLQD